jgi:hypothetical protein
MDPKEIMFYLKQGLGVIETLRDGKPKNTHFNQFSQYDMSVSPGIGTIIQVKQQLEDLVGNITGVTRPQQGQIAATDQVGTTQMAIQQSNVVTEYYFLKHEELIELLLTRLVNIFPYAYAEGKKGAYVVGKEKQEILNIHKDQLKGEFRVFVNSGSKEREIMQQAKQIAIQKYGQGQISAVQLIDMLNIDTIFEMRQSLVKYEKEMREMQQQMEQSNAEQQKQIQMEIRQMDMQMQQQLAQINGQVLTSLEQLKGQISLQKEQIKLQQKAQEMAADQEMKQMELQIEHEKIKLENDIENKYLDFEYVQLQVNDSTNRAQMLINRAKTAIETKKARSKERIKD